MSARTITKLIALGYIYKSADKADSRAYKLYLTEKAKVITPKIHEEIYTLVSLITEDINTEDKLITIDSLKKILSCIKSLNV
jgi:DNA-binding MarR family transcriptional regulator